MTWTRASKVKITRTDGSVVYQQARGRGRTPMPLIRAVFARDGLRCRYCGFSRTDSKFFHVDHVTPISKGGCDELKNLVVACRRCNLKKHDQTWTPRPL